MTTTPNPTAEQIVHDAIYGTKLMEPELRTLLANDSWALTRKAVAALRAAGLLGGDPTEEQIERAHDAGMNAVDWDMVREGVDDPAEAASIAVRIALAAAGVAPQELSAHVNPLATSGERVRNQTDSSHVAPQEPSPVASTPTVSDDSGHGGDDDRGGREDGPEDEGRSHKATVAGTPQRPSGCAECHRASGHKMDCSHRLAPSPDREKLIAELEFRSGKRAFPGETGYDQSHLDLMGVAADALAAQTVLDLEKDERVLAWEQVAAHPALKRCYGEERPLLHAVLDRLTNLYELEQTVNELAPAPEYNPLDPEKVAEVIEYYYDVPGDRLDLIARALCEAAKRGELNADR